MLELYRVDEAFTACFFDVTLVHTIMLGRCGDVTSIQQMKRPRALFVYVFVDLDVETQWCQWHLVVVDWAANVGVG